MAHGFDVQISKELVPPGGWRFYESGFTFEAQTFPELVGLLRDHRHSNSLPAGDPEPEIMVQLGEKYPNIVLNQPVMKPPAFVEKVKAFAAVLTNHLAHGAVLVDQNTANIRSTICRYCHNNVAPGPNIGNCGPCEKMAEKGVDVIRAGVLHGRQTPNDDKLKSCALCSCDLRMKVWFQLKTLGHTKEEVNAFPDFCWIKKIAEDKEV